MANAIATHGLCMCLHLELVTALGTAATETSKFKDNERETCLESVVHVP